MNSLKKEIPCDVECDVSSENLVSHKFLQFAGLYFALVTPFYVAVYVYCAYHGKALLQDVLSYRANDNPGLPELSRLHGVRGLGEHYFGDFLNVWAYTKYLGWGGYYGASQIVMRVLSFFNYWTAFTIFILMMTWFIYQVGRKIWSDASRLQSVGLGILLLIINQPMISAIDRGQIHVFVTLLMCLAFVGVAQKASESNVAISAAVLIGLAGSIKLFPGIFALYFAVRRQWSLFWISISSYIFFLIVGALMTSKGLSVFVVKNVDLYLSTTYFEQTIPYNHSLKAFGYAFKNQFDGKLSELGHVIFSHNSVISVLLILITSICLFIKRPNCFRILCALTVLATISLPITASYAMSAFLIPIVFWLTDRRETFRKQSVLIVLCILQLVPKQIPLNFGSLNDGSLTYNNILSPIVSMLILGICLFSRIVPASCEESAKVEFLRPQYLRDAIISSIKMRLRIVIAAGLLIIFLMIPNSMYISGSEVSTLRFDNMENSLSETRVVKDTLQSLGPLGSNNVAYDRVRISFDFSIRNRPPKNKNSALLTTSALINQGLQLKLDMYGSLFLDIANKADVASNFQALIKEELSFETKHTLLLQLDKKAQKISIILNGQLFDLKDLRTGLPFVMEQWLPDFSNVSLGGDKAAFSGQIMNVELSVLQGGRELNTFGLRLFFLLSSVVLCFIGLKVIDNKKLERVIDEPSAV